MTEALIITDEEVNKILIWAKEWKLAGLPVDTALDVRKYGGILFGGYFTKVALTKQEGMWHLSFETGCPEGYLNLDDALEEFSAWIRIYLR